MVLCSERRLQESGVGSRCPVRLFVKESQAVNGCNILCPHAKCASQRPWSPSVTYATRVGTDTVSVPIM